MLSPDTIKRLAEYDIFPGTLEYEAIEHGGMMPWCSHHWYDCIHATSTQKDNPEDCDLNYDPERCPFSPAINVLDKTYTVVECKPRSRRFRRYPY